MGSKTLNWCGLRQEWYENCCKIFFNLLTLRVSTKVFSLIKVISVHLNTHCWTSWRISSAMSTAKGKQKSWVTSRIISTVNWGPSLLNLYVKTGVISRTADINIELACTFDKGPSAFFAHFKIFTELNYINLHT